MGRYPGVVGKPHRRHEHDGLPRQGLPQRARPARGQRPRLPPHRRRLHRDGDAAVEVHERARAAARLRRARASRMAVRRHRAPALPTWGVVRGRELRPGVRRQGVPGRDRLLGAGGELPHHRARVHQRQGGLHGGRGGVHRLHVTGLPRQVHPLLQASAADHAGNDAVAHARGADQAAAAHHPAGAQPRAPLEERSHERLGPAVRQRHAVPPLVRVLLHPHPVLPLRAAGAKREGRGEVRQRLRRPAGGGLRQALRAMAAGAEGRRSAKRGTYQRPGLSPQADGFETPVQDDQE